MGKWEQKAAMVKWLRMRKRDRWEGWTPPPRGRWNFLTGASPHKTEARKKKKRWDDKTLLVDSLKTYFPG